MKKKCLLKLKSIILNFIGSTLLAFGVCAFVEPFGIIVGGSTGIALVLPLPFTLDRHYIQKQQEE